MKNRFTFRIWNRHKKEYEKPILDSIVFLFGKFFSCCDIYNEKKYSIEQCTGLKDKNGTLIYEGDLLKWKNYDKYPYLTRVVWCNPLSRFSFVPEDKSWCSDTYLEPGFNNEIEVVGNIHERQKIKPCRSLSKCNNAEGCDNCSEYHTWLKESEGK